MDCHALLQGIFPTQGSNPGLPHCRQILYHLSHQGSPGGGGFPKCNHCIAVSTALLGGDRVLCLDLSRCIAPGVQIHSYCGRWYWGVSFYSGDSEGHLRGHQKSKVSSKVPWERPCSISRASSGSDKCSPTVCLAFSGGFYWVAHMCSGSHSRVS